MKESWSNYQLMFPIATTKLKWKNIDEIKVSIFFAYLNVVIRIELLFVCLVEYFVEMNF